MKSNIILGINPLKIDKQRWREAFQDVIKISKSGELSHRESLRWNGMEVQCNRISDAFYDLMIETKKWIADGDLVRGFTNDSFTLIEDVDFYRNLWKEASHREVDQIRLNDIYNNHLIIWNGDTGQERAHIWLLAIACFLHHRFPDATYVYGGNKTMEYIRATAIAGNIIGEPVEIPVPFNVADITEPMSEIIDDATQAKNFDCMDLEDLYYWDCPEDSIAPEIEQQIKKVIDQIGGRERIYHERFLEMAENEAKCIAFDLLCKGNAVLSEGLWKEIIQKISDGESIILYVALVDFDPREAREELLKHILVMNDKLFRFCWGKHRKEAVQ